MTAPEQQPGPMPKLLAARGVKLRVTAGSVTALALGTWLAPPSAPTALSTPQEHAAPLLEEQVQLQEVVRPFRGVQEVSSRVRRHGVAIPPHDRARVTVYSDFAGQSRGSTALGFGVFVSDTHVLTHASVLEGRHRAPVTLDGRTIDMPVVAYEPSTGLALLRAESAVGSPASFAAAAPDAGMLAVAVGSSDGRDIALPLFVMNVAEDRYTLTATTSRTVRTMPLYNLEGELLAIAVNDGSEWQAFPARDAAERLLARASAPGGRCC
jgi:S1-C subfamily serine protease